MSHNRDEKRRFPFRWATQIYGLLAAGRYAAHWLPELLTLYSIVSDENSPEDADQWLLDELKASICPSLLFRVFLIASKLHKVWKNYKKVMIRD